MLTQPETAALAVRQAGFKGRPNQYSEWFSSKYNAPFRNSAWCAMFVTWVMMTGGLVPQTGAFASCPLWVSALKKKGKFVKTPEPGHLVFYDWDNDGVADHVGIVLKVLDAHTIATVEGNTTKNGRPNSVATQTRSMSDVLGFGVVSYAAVSNKVKWYTVKKGDTLSKVGALYNVPWKSIYEANKAVIGSDPGMIKTGMKLKIP